MRALQAGRASCCHAQRPLRTQMCAHSLVPGCINAAASRWVTAQHGRHTCTGSKHTMHHAQWRRQQQACIVSAAVAAGATQQAPTATATAAAAATATLAELRGAMQLYNTMSRAKEVFTPRKDQGDHVQMYVCGVTVYDYSHIGHARVYVAFDVLYRLLRDVLKYDVQYVRNFTDIDDKIIKRAAEAGEDPLALSSRFIGEFHHDMELLGCLRPTLEPKATDHIGDMVATIETIIANGHAYAVDGDVYFDVPSLPSYGQLSGRSQDDNRAGERVAVDDRKRSPADFALWKAAKAGEPSWDSPWGPGRPGWHIECSAMIRHVMGPVIDIHGGGRDLVFPHHENELAQAKAASSCCCGEHDSHSDNGFVRYWVHNGFVNVESEKMSKSLGNFFTIRDVLELYHPLALRWFLMGSQYRAPINYTQRALDEASDRFYYVLQTVEDADGALQAAGPEGSAALQAACEAQAAGAGAGSALVSTVVKGLLDDLNTPVCVSELAAPLKAVNDLLTTKAGRKAKNRLTTLAELRTGITSALDILGLGVSDISATLGELKARALARAGMEESEVTAAIDERAAARAAKDFAAADAVRQRLASKGIMIMDTPTGTTWRPGIASEGREQ